MKAFNYFCELKKELKLSEKIFGEYNIINFSGELLCVEGKIEIKELSSLKITLLANKKNKIFINGENLSIKALSENTIAIKGKIIKVEVEKNES